MIRERIENLMKLSRVCRLMIFDMYGLSGIIDYSDILKEHGFRIVQYTRIESFRIEYEEIIKNTEKKVAVIVGSNIYVPYDIQQRFCVIHLSLSEVFPKLHTGTVLRYVRDIDLISFAYEKCYADASTPSQTEDFIRDNAFTENPVEQCCVAKTAILHSMCESAGRYTDWIDIAKLKAVIHYYAASVGISLDLSFVDDAFADFIETGYSNLSLEIGAFAPAIITKTLNTICGANAGKVALVVMDCMSMFDFEVLSRYFDDIGYRRDGSFALIPTTTPISRQSLLSGKYPRQLEKPFSLANEEKEFVAAGVRIGYTANQIQYLRGFSIDVSPMTKLVAVIINDIDEIVHGQYQERIGMYNDMNFLGKSGKLNKLIKSLVSSGFTVYITADHGNTPCVGVGGFRSGIEVESRSMRMAIMKDFALDHEMLAKHAKKYPGYYLDKSYNYYVCESGVSYNRKGESIISHGGISIDEVIVPFVRIMEVK